MGREDVADANSWPMQLRGTPAHRPLVLHGTPSDTDRDIDAHPRLHVPSSTPLMLHSAAAQSDVGRLTVQADRHAAEQRALPPRRPLRCHRPQTASARRGGPVHVGTLRARPLGRRPPRQHQTVTTVGWWLTRAWMTMPSWSSPSGPRCGAKRRGKKGKGREGGGDKPTSPAGVRHGVGPGGGALRGSANAWDGWMGSGWGDDGGGGGSGNSSLAVILLGAF